MDEDEGTDIDQVLYDNETRERTPEEDVELAEAAIKRMEEEWLQNEFGAQLTDVIFDALNMFIERRKTDAEPWFASDE